MSEHYYDGRESKQVVVCDTEGCVLSVRDHYAIAALNGIVANATIAKMLADMKAEMCNAGMSVTDFQNHIEFPSYAKAAAAIADFAMKERKAQEFGK